MDFEAEEKVFMKYHIDNKINLAYWDSWEPGFFKNCVSLCQEL